MRGHQPLIERRLRGWKPSDVFVSDGMDLAKTWATWPEWADQAHVEIEPVDKVTRLDLRYAWGMTVHLQCQAEPRMRALSQAFLDAGATCVVAALIEIVGEEAQVPILEIHHRKEAAAWQA